MVPISADRFQQQPPRHDDAGIARAKVLLGSVEDWTDAGLARAILHPKAGQAGEPGIDLALIVELIAVLAGELGPVVRIRHRGIALDEGMLARMAGFPAV